MSTPLLEWRDGQYDSNQEDIVLVDWDVIGDDYDSDQELVHRVLAIEVSPGDTFTAGAKKRIVDTITKDIWADLTMLEGTTEQATGQVVSDAKFIQSILRTDYTPGEDVDADARLAESAEFISRWVLKHHKEDA